MKGFKFIKMEISSDGRIATITLNRPEKKNAINLSMHREIDSVLSHLSNEKNLGALIVTGTKDSFSAGADVRDVFIGSRADPKRFHEINTISYSWLQKLRNFPKPTVAAVNGYCIGGGISILGACDLAVASSKATLVYQK